MVFYYFLQLPWKKSDFFSFLCSVYAYSAAEAMTYDKALITADE